MTGWRKPSVCVLLLAVVCPALLLADLEAVKKEPNLLKRSQLALDHADAVLDVARKSYRQGEPDKVDAALREIQESIELAYQALQDTGRPPRSISGRYKRGEISTRRLLRRLETFQNEMSYLERDTIEGVVKAVDKVHHDFLIGVMGGGR